MTTVRSLKAKFAAGCVPVFLCLSLAHAQSPAFTRACQKWIDEKGYSTDYIEQKTGKRQEGLASEWRGNVASQDIQAGDVVLIRLPVRDAMHAAFAEEIRRNAEGTASSIRISEWNWGRMTDQRCLITENFGGSYPPHAGSVSMPLRRSGDRPCRCNSVFSGELRVTNLTRT